MTIEQFTYACLLLFTISYPLFRSFEHRVRYSTKWRFLFPPMIITAIIFIVWDIIFEEMGIWHFNPAYVTGIFILNLPVEEWLFFIIIPFACFFIYEVVKYFDKKQILQKASRYITPAFSVVLVLTGILNFEKLYTSVTFISTGVFLALTMFIKRAKTYFGHFYLAYFISIIPFLIVNGILTKLPVVTYNNTENLGIRIYTIPVEDSVYLFLLLLLTVVPYESLSARAAVYKPIPTEKGQS